MSRLEPVHLRGSERRRFERVDVPSAADLHVTDHRGKRLGAVRQLGRGGCALEPVASLKVKKRLKVVLVCEREGISRALDALVRYKGSDGTGLEFENLDADSAVDIGILIGRFYAADTAHA